MNAHRHHFRFLGYVTQKKLLLVSITKSINEKFNFKLNFFRFLVVFVTFTIERKVTLYLVLRKL